MKKLKIEIVQGKNNDWHWRITGSNGRILASSEVYSSKRKATNTAVMVMTAEFELSSKVCLDPGDPIVAKT